MIDQLEVFNDLRSLSGDQDSFVLHWRVPPQIPYLNGHFPKEPIFPAVGVIDATVQALGHHLSNPEIYLRGVVSAKFMTLIRPAQELEIEFKKDNDLWDVEWREASSRQVCAQLRIQVSA